MTLQCAALRGMTGALGRWRGTRTIVVAALGIAAGGCGDVARLVTPGDPAAGSAARVALTASVRASTNSADVVALQVLSEYVRRGGGRARLGTFSYQLSPRPSQAVPIPVDLATCLADGERDVANAGERVCPVMLTLSLQVNGTLVDRQVIGPLRLAPGGTVGIDQPVSLFDISAIEVTEASATPARQVVDEFTVVAGGGTSLVATVRDRNGQLVSERAVTWSSEAPGIASINASTGVVTGVAIGTARITASIGTLDKTVTMRVARPPAALTVEAGNGTGSGVVRSDPAGIDCRITGNGATGNCSAAFPGDAQVTLTATADAGSVAPAWGGSCVTVSTPSCRVTMDQPRVARVHYTALRRLTIAADGDGRGRVVGDFGIDCQLAGQATSGRCSADVPDGTSVSLRALAGDGSSATLQTFDGWGGECAAVTTPTCSVSVTGGTGTVVARFLDARRLTIALSGTGSGRVIADDGVACTVTKASACSRDLVYGATVSLRAVADSGATFVGWGGACAEVTSTTCLTTLSESRAVAATFTALRRLEVVAARGDGRGRVTGPGGLDCRVDRTQVAGTCAVDLLDEVTATLTATPDEDRLSPQFFGGWGDDCAAVRGAVCTVTLDGTGRRAAVTFRAQPRLRVDVIGTGGGSVSASVLGISCVRAGGATSGVCERGVDFGATVQLVATPDANSTFGGWSGVCAAFSGPTCTTTLLDAAQVSARFVARLGTLTLTVTGTGGGGIDVNGAPACAILAGRGPRTCTVSYDIGRTLQLRATPAGGSRFGAFSGDCSEASPCTLVMAPARAATARFDVVPPPPPPTATLTLQLTGSSAGDVALGGMPFCTLTAGRGSATCTTTVAVGSVVSLTASAPAGSTVGAWGGACAGYGACQLQVTANATVTLSFVPVPVTVTLWLAGSSTGGTVRSTAPGIDCSITQGVTTGACAMTVPYGSVVTFDATPRPRSRVEAWMGACSTAKGTTCTLVLTSDARVGVAFARAP